jgi:preprotein translocase subunit SecD
MGLFTTECIHCGSKEHASDDCPHGVFSSKKCIHCGSIEHASDDCPHGVFSSKKCIHCGSIEHASDDCPHGVFSSKKCIHCGSIEHASDDCPHGIFTPNRKPTPSIPTGTTSSDSSGCGTLIAWLVGIGIVIFLAIWLAVNIVLPVALLNSALGLAVLAVVFKKQRTLFAILAFVGGVYMLLDITNGWFSLNFVTKVVKNPNWISAFVYINAAAIGFCTWLLIQPIWSRAKLISVSDKRRGILLMGISIFLIAIGTISAPIIYHFAKNPGATKIQSIKTLSNSEPFVFKNGIRIGIELSVEDFLRALSKYNPDKTFNSALARAKELQKQSQFDYLTLFGRSFQEVDPNAKLASIFGTVDLKEKINFNSTNEEVLKVIRQECSVGIDRTINILRNRFDFSGFHNANITKDVIDNRIIIELPDISINERIRKLLYIPGNLEFWETYSSNELIKYFSSANELLAAIQYSQTEKHNNENPLFMYLHLLQKNDKNIINNDPRIGYSSINDTARINQILKMNQFKAIFPRDLKLVWTAKPSTDMPTMVELIALKITSLDGSPAIDGDLISNTDLKKKKQEIINLVLDFNTEGEKIWRSLINRNIGKQIAIMFDGYVYSLLNIDANTKSESCNITGNFTKEEGQDLVNLIKAGKLPATIHIMYEQKVGK